jgi:hypothetical protein
VKIGISTSVDAQITEGLKQGEKVVVAQASAKSASSQRNNTQSNPLNPMAGRRPGGGRPPGGG